MEAQKPNTPQKPVAAKSKTEATHKVRGIKNAFLVILCCFVIAVLLFIFWFGDYGKCGGLQSRIGKGRFPHR